MNDLSKLKFPLNEKFGLIILSNNVKYEFILNIKNSDKLLVIGSGALPLDYREKFLNRPLFHRISWEFENSVIYYNDPTRYLNKELVGGWGLGTMENWYLNEISNIIKIIANKIFKYTNEKEKFKNIIFYGSSMGGFMSLQLSILIKNSTAIAEIPQLDLCEWHYWHTLKLLFGNLDISEIKKKFNYKLNIMELITKEKYIPNAYLILDCSSQRDFETQYKNFFNNLNKLPFTENNNVNKIKIRIDGKNKGHRQLSKPEICEFIENVCLIIDNSQQEKK